MPKEKSNTEKACFNKDYSLNGLCFEMGRFTYRIIETKYGENKKTINALDLLQNTTSKQTKQYKRSELIKVLKKYKAKLKDYVSETMETRRN
jgi:predicted component of viral defense system (DUF524 family)